VHTRFTFTGKTNAVPGIHACRNLDGQRLVFLYGAAAMTDMTRILDGLACAMAARAGLLHGERPLAHTHLAYAAAGNTVLGHTALARTGAITGVTGDAGRNSDFDGGAAHRVFEGKLEGVAEVGSTLNVTATTAAENVAEDIAKNVAKAGMTAATHVATHACMTKLVV